MRFPVLILLAAVLPGCKKPAASVPPAPPATPEPAAQEVLEKALTPVLAAYQAGDARALHAQFAKAAPGITDAAVVEQIYMKFYREKFGRLKGVRFSPRESTLDRDRGMLVYDAAFEKGIAKLSANFLREDGQVRLMQMRIEEIEEE